MSNSLGRSVCLSVCRSVKKNRNFNVMEEAKVAILYTDLVYIDEFQGGAAAPPNILVGYLLGQKWKIFMAKKDFHDTYKGKH